MFVAIAWRTALWLVATRDALTTPTRRPDV
jgi:hypothetical protein